MINHPKLFLHFFDLELQSGWISCQVLSISHILLSLISWILSRCGSLSHELCFWPLSPTEEWALPMHFLFYWRYTLLFALTCVGRPNDGTFPIDNDYALNIFVSLYTVECFLNFWHVTIFININQTDSNIISNEQEQTYHLCTLQITQSFLPCRTTPALLWSTSRASFPITGHLPFTSA